MSGRKILWLEPVGGCAGDMTLAALLDLGVPVDAVERELRKLPVTGWSLRVEPGAKMGIHGIRVDVEVDEAHHGHDHHDHDHHHGRTWGEIRGMIEGAGLSPGAVARALAIFGRLAEAEARIHGTTPEAVHFHEVGAVDSIVDVVGVAVALDLLGPSRILSAPPPLGSGTVHSQHGPMPVPAPATLELLRGRAVRSSGPGERTTPTGAAILAAMAEDGTPSSFVPERIGYGVGHRDFDDAPNVLRATMGREGEGGEDLFVLECNLDDTTPQILAHAIDACLEAGALDAWVAPITMKKGRPAHLVGALVPGPARDGVLATLVRETPTLGIRWHKVERFVLERDFDEVETSYGTVPVKVGKRGDSVLTASPEWDVCVRRAREHGVPPREVREEALARWRQAFRSRRS